MRAYTFSERIWRRSGVLSTGRLGPSSRASMLCMVLTRRAKQPLEHSWAACCSAGPKHVVRAMHTSLAQPRAKVRFCSATRQRARWAAFRAPAMRKALSATMRGLRRCAAISTAKRSKRSSRLMPMSFAPSRRRPTFRRNCSQLAQELKKVLLMWLPPWMCASRRL